MAQCRQWLNARHCPIVMRSARRYRTGVDLAPARRDRSGQTPPHGLNLGKEETLMRRSIVPLTTCVLVLLFGGLVGAWTPRSHAQEAGQAPEARTDLGKYVTIIRLGQTTTLQGRSDQALYLDLLIFDEATPVPPLTYRGAQVLYVDAGTLIFEFSSVRGNAQVTRTPAGDRCAGPECDVKNYLRQIITLQPGDVLTHDGEVVYSVAVEPAVKGARRALFGAPGQALGGGASGHRACASGCG
jgi:hypothetical protein